MARRMGSCIGMLAMLTCCMVFAISLTCYVANASDPSPLQDFCIGVNDAQSTVFVNGFFCKNPKDVTANDFLYKGFDTVGDTNNKLGSKVVQVNSTTFPAINTLGVAMGRVDFAPGGLNPPHLHPRSSEMLTVIEGTLYAGFISSNLQSGGNKLYAKIINNGDIFVFPQGLIHFQLNLGSTPAVANVAFGSQTPGLVTIASAVFGSMPPFRDFFLSSPFQIQTTNNKAHPQKPVSKTITTRTRYQKPVFILLFLTTSSNSRHQLTKAKQPRHSTSPSFLFFSIRVNGSGKGDPEMVSDAELVSRLRVILQSSDLHTTTAGAVRRQLESDFGVDLSDRKKFVSQQIDEFLQSVNDDNGEEEDGEENVDQLDEQQADENGKQEEEQEEQEEEEEEESDEKSSKRKRSKDGEANKKRKATGFTRLCSLSPPLQEFLGVSEMARTEVVKQLWVYIRDHNLQDPNNRRNIKCDKKLHSIFRVDTINMFQMNKALTKHIWPLEAEEETATNSQHQEKKQKRQKEDVKNSKQKSKQQKGGTSGFLKPLQLSDAFVKFLGTGETSLSRSDAVKRMWDYIKQNDLQDPSDKRRILCDKKLKELFEVDSFTGFSVSKLLTAHLMKIE